MQPIHISDVLAFKRCRRLWNWSSLLRGNLTRKRVYAPFFIGRAIHYALEQYYRFGVDVTKEALEDFLAIYHKEVGDQAFQADINVVMEQMLLARGIVDHYLVWQSRDKTQYADRNLEFISLETSFKAPLRTPKGGASKRFYLEGRFDGVVRLKADGRLYLWEVKTTRSITERLKILPHEEQANAYMIAAQELYKEPIEGVIYTVLRKKLPETPQPLKRDPFLSRNSSIDSTAEHYLQAVRDFHGDQATPEFIKEHYNDVLANLLSEPNKFFARCVVRRSPAELDRARQELYSVALEMTSPKIGVYPHGGQHCNYCNFREPCISLNNGGNYTEMLAAEYQPNTYHIQGDANAEA